MQQFLKGIALVIGLAALTGLFVFGFLVWILIPLLPAVIVSKRGLT